MLCRFKDAGHNKTRFNQGMAINVNLSRFGCDPMIVTMMEVYNSIINQELIYLIEKFFGKIYAN